MPVGTPATMKTATHHLSSRAKEACDRSRGILRFVAGHVSVRSLRSARKLATVGMTMGVTRSLSLMPPTDIFKGACEGSHPHTVNFRVSG